MGRAMACRYGCGDRVGGSCEGVGGILLFSPTVRAGPGGERRGTYTGTHTHTGTYTRMLHLPFSDLPLKKCPTDAPHLRPLAGSARNVVPPWGGDSRLGDRVMKHVLSVLKDRKASLAGEQITHDVTVYDPLQVLLL